MHGHAIQTAHFSFNRSPPLPCVESKSLTHSLASGSHHKLTFGFLCSLLLTCLVSWNCNYSICLLCSTAIPLLESLLHTCLVSGNHCCAVYACSCPVWGHLACLTRWPPQHWQNVSHSHALVLQVVRRCERHRVVWRALLLCNLFKHMRAFMCVYSLHVSCVGRLSVFLCIYAYYACALCLNMYLCVRMSVCACVYTHL